MLSSAVMITSCTIHDTDWPQLGLVAKSSSPPWLVERFTIKLCGPSVSTGPMRKGMLLMLTGGRCRRASCEQPRRWYRPCRLCRVRSATLPTVLGRNKDEREVRLTIDRVNHDGFGVGQLVVYGVRLETQRGNLFPPPTLQCQRPEANAISLSFATAR